MKKLKILFGISMLCAIMASCNPEWPESDYYEGTIIFRPLALRFGNNNYQIRDSWNNWTTHLTAGSEFNSFIDALSTPNTFSSNATNNSKITVTSEYPGRTPKPPRESTNARRNGIGANSLIADIYIDGRNSLYVGQSLNVEIISGRYRRTDNGWEGNLTWSWRGRDYDYGINDIVYQKPGNEIPMILELNAGALRTTAKFVTIVDNSSSGGSGINYSCSCHNNKPPLPNGQMYFCDCLQPLDVVNDGRLFIIDDSRFSEMVSEMDDLSKVLDPSRVLTVNDWSAIKDNAAIINAVQTDVNEGVLTVFATAEAYSRMR